MTTLELSCLLVSVGSVAISAATLFGANRITTVFGQRLELFQRQRAALQAEVSRLETAQDLIEKRLERDWLGLGRSPELRVAELLRQRQTALVILVRAPQSLDSRFVFLMRGHIQRQDEAARSLFRLESDVLMVECHRGYEEAMLQADRICASIQHLGLVVAEIQAPSPSRWAIDQAMACLLRLPAQGHVFLLVKPS